jgi:uncharacterized repeat protein (TIGR03803 family)
MRNTKLSSVLIVGLVIVPYVSGAGAGTEKVLYNFTGGRDGGYLLDIGHVARDGAGNLFGTTEEGGNQGCFNQLGCGTVFELSLSNGAYTEKTLHVFTGGSDGANPATGVTLDSAGHIYGTTYGGGTYGGGTVFELTPAMTADPGWTETVLYSFGNGTDGGGPEASVILDAAGNIYGTTYSGGNLACNAPYGCGVAYEISSSGVFSVIYSFCSATACADGADPEGSLAMDSAGTLYGMTGFGGSEDLGTVFELSTKAGLGWKETVLHSFNGSDGYAYPSYGGLTLVTRKIGNKKKDVIFGVTGQGGSNACNCGTVFEIRKSGSGYALTVLHSFVGANGDGSSPYGTLVEANGKLFGTTFGGGDLSQSCNNGSGCGIVFELAYEQNVWTETILYTFTGNDGESPTSGLVADSRGNLYGVTAFGGSGGDECYGEACGVVYGVRP